MTVLDKFADDVTEINISEKNNNNIDNNNKNN